MDPAEEPISMLLLDQLAQVLLHVDIKPRLSSCSLVSSTWRTAAARATTSIKQVAFTPSFGPWLRLHTAQVQVSSLVLTCSDSDFALPVAQLQSLKCLELHSVPWRPDPDAAYTAAQPRADLSGSSSRGSSMQGLERLTALTQLQLTRSSVRLAGLSALTGLQELTLFGIKPAFELLDDVAEGRYDNIPGDASAVADLVAAFRQLQHLTSLTLGNGIASTAVMSQLSALQSLQQLVLDSTTADSFAALPQSLTQLTLSFKRRGKCLISSNAEVMSQLTAMQSLYLRTVKLLDLGLLAGMHSLRSLQLHDCVLVAGGCRLQVFSRLTALTSLSIEGQALAASPITAAEAGALTSSSQLAELELSGLAAQLQAYASLCPPGRQLQHLTRLDIGADLLRNPAVVCQAGECWPNLQSLKLGSSHASYGTGWEAGEVSTVADSLTTMSAWSSLRELRLDDPWPQLKLGRKLPAPLWQALGKLSQLTGLHMFLPRVAAARDDGLHLMGCKGLQRLV